MPEELDRLESVLAGRYAIEGDLGAGGMAVVYLARDLKHDRRVAIKVLRSHLAAAVGAERFLREVQITARLGHPNILLLIDSGTAGGLLYYVMPYIEGESLRRRLEREQRLPVADATRIAREVADALAYAHGLGVVHRDIKPENILLEAGHAVVSDFGIAHAVSVAGADRLTETGLVMGTPAYMSPEQAMGERDLDGRSDVYSLGCVLYEMLAGEPPFSGSTPQAILTRRLTEPAPRVSAVRDGIPPEVEEALSRALAREPGARLTAAQVAERLVLDMAAARALGRRARLALGAAAAVAVLVMGALLVSGPGGGADRIPSAGGAVASGFGRRLAQLTFGAGVEEWPAWSPDGASLAYVAETGGYKKLFLRPLATGAERQLTRGAADEIEPTWSSDGRTIALVRSNLARGKLEPTDIRGWYQDGGDIWTLDLASGRETQIVANAFDPAYSPDGRRLAFAARWSGPRRVWIADASGHNAQQVSTEGSEAVVHGTPRWSPDGTKLVFRRIEQTKSDIVLLDIASRSTIRLTDDNVLDTDPVWSPDGAFVYFSSFRGGGLNLWRLPVGRDGGPAEAAQQITTGAGDDGQATLDPEGRRLAFSILGYDSDLWRLPVDPSTGRATGEPQPVIGTTRVESRGAWSPDGRRIAFNSDRAGEMNIWVRSLGDGTDRQVTTGSGGDYQPNWSPDGQTIVFFSARGGHSDIWSVAAAGGPPTRLTEAPGADINPFHSPDGRRIAFHSDRDGRPEVWVMNADGSGQRKLTSIGAGGHFMRWSADSRWVIFRAEPAGRIQIHRVSVETGRLERLPDVVGGSHMSFSPDRSRIMDIRDHKVLWVYPLRGEAPQRVFEFPNPEIRIDYTVWSPDGRWVLFDRAMPRGGDIWTLEGLR